MTEDEVVALSEALRFSSFSGKLDQSESTLMSLIPLTLLVSVPPVVRHDQAISLMY